MHDLLISGGRVIDPESGLDAVAGVAVIGGAIMAVGHDLGAAARTIDARDLVVAPGFIDLHAHGQSLPADRMQAFDGETTTLELELVRTAQRQGLKVMVEAYPYGVGSTVVGASFFSDPEFPERTGGGYDTIELCSRGNTSPTAVS